MIRRSKTLLIVLAVFLIGLALRLPALSLRVMHGDEAVHAVKFGKLLEENDYKYDPDEYHGPTLNYFTLIPAWLAGKHTFAEVNEVILRIVPVAFGMLMILLPLLLIKPLGRTAALYAAIFTAVSPAFAFYSRYYIQETLLACFTLGLICSGYHLIKTAKYQWAILTGVFIGLMHATKETCVIAYFAIACALALTWITGRKHISKNPKPNKSVDTNRSIHVILIILITILCAAGVSALFFSSFGSNSQGIIDSVTTYKTYLDRGTKPQLHQHGWDYYLKMLMFFRHEQGPGWSEAFVLVLAVAGLIATFMPRYSKPKSITFLRFICFYTAIITIIYCAVPYKTPWSMLSFYNGFIIVAAVGADLFIRMARSTWRKSAVYTIIAISVFALFVQAYFANFKMPSDPYNPYVYAHPLDDVFKIKEKVDIISASHPDGTNMYIQVICPKNDYWPLPWYLRKYKSVGWFDAIDEKMPLAELIILSPKVEDDLLKRISKFPPGKKPLYIPIFDEPVYLRPMVEINGYVTKELWDMYNAK